MLASILYDRFAEHCICFLPAKKAEDPWTLEDALDFFYVDEPISFPFQKTPGREFAQFACTAVIRPRIFAPLPSPPSEGLENRIR